MNCEIQESRLRKIEDRFTILDLEAEYAYAWDLGGPDRWAEVFTEDGVFEMLPAGAMPGFRATGRPSLEAFCREIRQQWTGLHYMHPPRLRLEGDQAESVIFFEFRHVMRSETQVRQGITAGYYRTRYRRTPEGWRMQERIEQAIGEDLSLFYPPAFEPTERTRP